MSFDDYAKHLIEKYRLSTAIAVIKTKPENLTIEQHLNELRNKIKNKMDDDLDISICSDDFKLEDDDLMIGSDDHITNISGTIFRDYDLENDDLFDVPVAHKSVVEWPQVATPYNPENLTQTTYYETQLLNPNPLTQSEHNPIIEQATDINATYCSTIDIQNNIPKDIVEKDLLTDTQKTILYTVCGFTQNTHYSPSQTNIIIPKAHIYGINNNKHIRGFETNNSISKNDVDVITDIHTGRDVNNDNFSSNDIPNTINTDVINDNERIMTTNTSQDRRVASITYESQNTWNKLQYASNDTNKTNDKYVMNDNEKILTKEACGSSEILNIYSKSPYCHDAPYNNINLLKNFTNDNRNIKQREVLNDNDGRSIHITFNNSQNANISSENRNAKVNIVKKPEQIQISEDINVFSQNLEQYNEENVINNNINTKDSLDSHNAEFDHLFNIHTTKNIPNQASMIDVNYSRDIRNTGININNNNDIPPPVLYSTYPTFENTGNTDVFSQNDEIFNDNEDNNDKITNITTETRGLNREVNESRQIISLPEDTQEVIPFKILDEFNKVRSFLSRNERMSTDGNSSDSGYRSDSQGRNNKSALQLSGNWLNQSGHSLFNYIMSCHLVVTTRDMTNEIAQVLGDLIDKLHEEEKYPSFLEALLEANNLLLRQLCEGDNRNENVLLNRDENIQRLILLNKSIHIQKYCIDKITNILSEYHTKLTDTEYVFELSNIDQIENLYYIFHLLEILLQKYNKNKDLMSQTSTQPSQDEGSFKKSSITDLWKRKWNPNYQDGGNEVGCEKTCVLQACCEILNKIIVDSLNCYSLVSYAALKCFNMTQS